MRPSLTFSVASMALAVGACATPDDVRTLRRAVLPPQQVILVDRGEQLFQNVAIYEILGAPEFRVFDGGAIVTTRPTRAQVAATLGSWLHNARMLAPDMARADYLLTVEFTDLRGPDFIPFNDKNASANVRYRLEHIRTREVLFEKTFDAAFQARMPGVTEEMVRAAIAGGVFGAAVSASVNDVDNESSAQGALVGAGLVEGVNGAAFNAFHEYLLSDWPLVGGSVTRGLVDGASHGLAIGSIGAALTENSEGELSDLDAGLMGGLVGAAAGFVGASTQGRLSEKANSPDMIGAFSGARRREQATLGMLSLNFNRFMYGLSEEGLLKVRRAVTCSELNPDGIRGPAIKLSTEDAVAYDCST